MQIVQDSRSSQRQLRKDLKFYATPEHTELDRRNQHVGR